MGCSILWELVRHEIIELGNDDFFSHSFFLNSDYIVKGVLKDNYPWILHTFKKMAGEIKINPYKNASFGINNN